MKDLCEMKISDALEEVHKIFEEDFNTWKYYSDSEKRNAAKIYLLGYYRARNQCKCSSPS